MPNPAPAVGQIVGRAMVAKPAVAGSGCTTTDTPHIDVTTAYPPFVSQVTLSYNAANGALTADKITELFNSSKGTGATSVSGVGDQAYSRDGDNGVVALDQGVMAMVGISSTRRPESLEEVRGYSAAIANKFLTAFPR
jgi:hypothetical protein